MKFEINGVYHFVSVKEAGKSNMYVLLDENSNKISTFGVDPEVEFEKFEKVEVAITVNLKKTKRS